MVARARTVRRGAWGRVLLAGVALLALPLALPLAGPPRPAAAAVVASPDLVTDPAALVDPLVGTTGGAYYGGHTTPAAVVPFGMVQWGPDTSSRPPGGGYAYEDAAISGFSLTHLSGPGCAAYGDIPILPTVGVVGAAGPGGVDPQTASQPFSHASEVATPGAYEVDVGAPAIHVELAATARAGLGRFTFPPTAAANLLVKTSGSAAGNDAAGAVVIGSDTIATSATSGHFCGSSATYTVYSFIQFSRPFRALGSWTSAGVQPGTRVATGAGSGVYVTFDTTATASVTARVGVSFVNVAGAAANVGAEVPAWDLAAVRAAGRAAWTSLLGRVQIGGGTSAEQRTFYTALYHSLLHPNIFSDVDGSYRGFDRQVHQATNGVHYANISGWDVYRTQLPLVAWLAPTEASAIVQSMIDDAHQNGGRLPKWTLANAETYVMVGDPAAPIIAGVAAFGARDFDLSGALALLVQQATVASNVRPGIDQYLARGYLPTDATYGCCSFTGPVSTTLEYASADFAISRLAGMTGGAADTATATTFRRRAANWRNLLQARDGLFQQRYTSGRFLTGPNPTTTYGFVEGDALQYAWAVPHDLAGLVNAVGGRATAIARLDRFFTQLNTGPSSPYAFMANEPAFAVPWTYVNIGVPSRTQDVVRRVRTELFSPTPAGLPGNDDLGAMSAWFVWASLGLYPSVPGTADLLIGSPLFPAAVVHAGNGTTTTINAPALSATNRYVGAAKLNGTASSRSWLPATTVLAGSTLDLTMAPAPGAWFGTTIADLPPSYGVTDQPVIGFSDPSGSVVQPNPSSRVLVVGAANVTATTQIVTWSATSTGVLGTAASVTPSSGTFTVPAAGRGTAAVTVSVPPAASVSDLRFAMSVNGVAVPATVVRVVGTAPGDLAPHADNAGISDDTNRPAANFDLTSFSYSRQALASVGVAAGATLVSGPLTYRWPTAVGGPPDNIVAAGQRLDLTPAPGAHTLGVLGASTNAGAGASGTATITYTDGTTSSFTLGLTDWTRGAGTTPVVFGNTVVATAPYLNCQCGASLPIATSVFQATTPVDPTRTVASLRLPSSVTGGDLHVFAVALA